MSVLIKGMEVPSNCLNCSLKVWMFCPMSEPSLDEMKKYIKERHPDCPIVAEVPDAHGRLIDAGRLKVVLKKNFGGASVLGQLIDEQPTVVEAEGTE